MMIRCSGVRRFFHIIITFFYKKGEIHFHTFTLICCYALYHEREIHNHHSPLTECAGKTYFDGGRYRRQPDDSCRGSRLSEIRVRHRLQLAGGGGEIYGFISGGMILSRRMPYTAKPVRSYYFADFTSVITVTILSSISPSFSLITTRLFLMSSESTQTSMLTRSSGRYSTAASLKQT